MAVPAIAMTVPTTFHRAVFMTVPAVTIQIVLQLYLQILFEILKRLFCSV
jgi:hypothetical protein